MCVHLKMKTDNYLNASPTGLIHMTKCRVLRTRLIKKSNIPSRLLVSTPAVLAASLTAIITFSYSSDSNKLGTSPKQKNKLCTCNTF